MESGSGKRNAAIDFWRIVFATVIMLWHGRGLGGGGPLCGEAGYIAVEYFYLVSGVLMATSACRQETINGGCDVSIGRETLSFVWRKIKSILPVYIFAVIFSFSRSVIANDMSFYQAARAFCLGLWDLCFLRASGIKTYGLVRATWFLSAMYISMLVIYPLLRKKKDTFVCIIAPVGSILILGWLSQTYGSLNQYVADYKFVYSGVLRAFAELSMGCMCYWIAKRIEAIRFNNLSKVLILAIQILGYLAVIACTTRLPIKQFDFVMLFILFICVTLTFSKQGVLKGAPLLAAWLGKLSMVFYLNHMWVKDTVSALLPKSMGYWKLLGIYLLAVFFVSAVCLAFEKGIHAFWLRYGSRIKGWFITV